MNRTSVCILAALVVAASSATPRAQVFHSFSGPLPVSDASPALGLVAGFGDDLFRLGGLLRVNVSPVSDLGFELVYDDIEAGRDDLGMVGGGADFRYRIVAVSEETPVDVALQGGGGFLTRSEFTLIRIPLGAVASRSFPLEGSREIVPYAGAFLIFSFLSPDGGDTDSDVDVEIRLGASAEIVDRAAVFSALHVGNGTMFFLGFSASL